MKTDIFVDAVESSTRLFGRKDVSVVFAGDGARTDGSVVYLPAIQSGAEINNSQASAIRGYRNHEAMHVRCTDTSAKSMARLAASQSDPLLHSLIQYSEDVRIEHAGIQEYPGMAPDLQAINIESAKELMQAVEASGGVAAVAASMPLDAAYRLVASHHGREVIGVRDDGVTAPLLNELRKRDPKLYDMAVQGGKLMADLPTGFSKGKLSESASKKGTEAAFDLAEKLASEVRAYIAQTQPQQPPPPPQPPEGDGKAEGEGDDGSGHGAGDEPDDCSGDDDSAEHGGNGGGNGKPKSDDSDGDSDADGPADDGDSDADADDEDGQDADDGDDNQDGDNTDDDGGDADDGDSEGGSSTNGGGNGENDSTEQSGQHGQQSDAGSGGNSSGDAAKPPTNISQALQAMLDSPDSTKQQAIKSVVNAIHSAPNKAGTARLRIWRSDLVYRSDSVIDMAASTYAANASQGVENTKSQMRRGWIRPSAFDDMAKAISGKRAMIRRILELELQARSDRHWTGGHSHGRLPSVRLVSAMQGAERVYQRREEGRDMDTVMRISIDGSGSMRGIRMKESCMLAIALVEALERTGCDIEITSWSSGAVVGSGNCSPQRIQDEVGAMNRAIRSGANFNTLGSLNIVHVKSVRQKFSDKRWQAEIGVLSCTSLCGTTPTHHAALSDIVEMSKHKHAKKILLHITDGDPDGLSCRPDGMTDEGFSKAVMHNIADQADSLGIHMIGVGIANMDVSGMYRDYVNVPGNDAYEPVIKRVAKLIAKEIGHAKRAA